MWQVWGVIHEPCPLAEIYACEYLERSLRGYSSQQQEDPIEKFLGVRGLLPGNLVHRAAQRAREAALRAGL